MKDNHTQLEEVLKASKGWMNAFNTGNAKGCANAYTENTKMVVTPMGTYEGKQAVFEFWDTLINQGAKDVVYTNTKLETIDDRTVLLSANWSMNIGRGIITEEKWVKQDDGKWLLEFDAFEIQEQY
ncbi:hypothetical protein UJ101_00366 [Flavobacteriaceae bacterium UJ101]|nr:hypothetical protein UJ101_00366 [Flavobacteriaceae bacterium UJ101]